MHEKSFSVKAVVMVVSSGLVVAMVDADFVESARSRVVVVVVVVVRLLL